MHAIAFFHIALLLCDRWVRQESHWMQPSEQLIRLKLLDPLHQCKLRAHGSLSWWIILPYQLFQCLIVWYFFAWCLLDSIYCISWYTSTSLMNWAAPYFCQHCLISHQCTKSVCPVVGVSLAGTTLDAAYRATHPAQATCARASEQLDSTWIWLLVTWQHMDLAPSEFSYHINCPDAS